MKQGQARAVRSIRPLDVTSAIIFRSSVKSNLTMHKRDGAQVSATRCYMPGKKFHDPSTSFFALSKNNPSPIVVGNVRVLQMLINTWKLVVIPHRDGPNCANEAFSRSLEKNS